MNLAGASWVGYHVVFFLEGERMTRSFVSGFRVLFTPIVDGGSGCM